MGGTCGPARPPEIGILDIELTNAGKNDPVFGTLPPKQKCLQWHSVEVAQAPDDAVVLASSKACPIQAMRIGNTAWSAQYHIELEADTVQNWGDVPAYAAALEASLGPSGLSDMDNAATANMGDFENNSRTLYRNFMNAISNN